jgi:hypothetical protein
MIVYHRGSNFVVIMGRENIQELDGNSRMLGGAPNKAAATSADNNFKIMCGRVWVVDGHPLPALKVFVAVGWRTIVLGHLGLIGVVATGYPMTPNGCPEN